jgi:hypothetical protein
MISQRTKSALKAAKDRGVVLGNPRLEQARGQAVASLKADADRFARALANCCQNLASFCRPSDRRWRAPSAGSNAGSTSRGHHATGCGHAGPRRRDAARWRMARRASRSHKSRAYRRDVE